MSALAALRRWLARFRSAPDAGAIDPSSGDRAGPRLRVADAMDDLAALRRLDTAYAAELYASFCGEPTLAVAIDLEGALVDAGGQLQSAYRAPSGLVLLAEVDGGLAGGVALRRSARSPDEAEVRRLYVAPGHRGQGLARRLLRRVVAEASALGYRRLLLSSADRLSSVHRLYLGQGFAQVAPPTCLPREVAPRFASYALLLG